ncbi:nicotinamidase/pyrazinamidase [Rhodocyclaceae bacterium]|nr:nicotinamidase/pyrazinamidase [Rhodocyclaceae bacterium]
MTTALILIDIQNDYFPGGALPVEGSEAATQEAARLLDRWRARHLPVIHVQHLSVRPGAPFLIPGTTGADIHVDVVPLPDEIVVTKNFPNSFRDTPLLERLRAVDADSLVIAGMMTHMCIDSTVRAAFDLGFRCVLAQDACATRNLRLDGADVPAAQVHTAFVAALNGLFAEARLTAAILADA